jgi:hypothetical protein
VSESHQLVIGCESSDSGDSESDEGTDGCGDDDGASGGAGDGGSSVVPIGGGSSAFDAHDLVARDESGTTSNVVAAMTSGAGTREGVTESSSSRLENRSGEVGKGLESLPPLERARRQVIGLTKAGDNVHAGLIHGNLNELIEKMRKNPSLRPSSKFHSVE